MKYYLALITTLLFTLNLQAQSDINLKEFDTRNEIYLRDEIKDEDGDYRISIVITWFDTCETCKALIDRFHAGLEGEAYHLITVNINSTDKLSELEGDDEYNRRWPNAKNLYVDKTISKPFTLLYSVSRGAMIIFFDSYGDVTSLVVNSTLSPEDFASSFGSNAVWFSSSELNTLAWTFFTENEESVPMNNELEGYQKAMKYIKRSIELDENFYNLDTYAALLYLGGHYTEALKKASEAVEKAKESDIDYSDTTALMQKILSKM